MALPSAETFRNKFGCRPNSFGSSEMRNYGSLLPVSQELRNPQTTLWKRVPLLIATISCIAVLSLSWSFLSTKDSTASMLNSKPFPRLSVHNIKDRQQHARNAYDLKFRYSARQGARSSVKAKLIKLDLESGELADLPDDPNMMGELNNLPEEPNLKEGELANLPEEPNLEKGELANLPEEPNLEKGELANLPEESNLEKGELANLPEEPNLEKGELANLPEEDNLAEGELSTLPPESNLKMGELSTLPPESNLEEGELSTLPPESNLEQGELATLPPESNL